MAPVNPSEPPQPAPRTLAEAIRAMDERGLVTLMLARPDLAQPRPASLAELVERASSPVSAGMAVDRLDTWQRAVAEALAAQPEPTTARGLAAQLDADTSAVQAALDTLVARALAWRTNTRTGTVLLTRAAAHAFGPHPAGLAAPSPMPLTDASIDALFADLPADQRTIVDKLVWQPVGRLRHAQRPITTTNASTPSEHLVAKKVLRPISDDQVVLAREVSLRLRGGRLFAEPVATRPAPLPPAEPTPVRANAALGTANEALELFTDLVEDIIAQPPRVLATGGLGRREFKQLAAHRNETSVALLLALARQAQLIAPQGLGWLATPAFDRWAQQPAWQQWRDLVRAWTHLDRWPSVDADPLAPQGQRPIVGVRRALLAELRHAPSGTAVDAPLLAARSGWRHPTWDPQLIAEAARHFVTEATTLGVLALGRTSHLLEADEDPGFPEPTHQFVVQADLSAMPVGPLQVAVRRRLDLLTDRERGTRRFTPTSIRRALDHGFTADQVIDWLTSHSLTPLPQPLTYLVGDVARQHGQIQVMPAAAVVTIADPAVLEALLRSPQAGLLGLTKVGPQAVVTQGDVAEVVEALQAMGHAPVAKSANGEQVHAPRPRRASHAAAPVTEPEPPGRDQVEMLARQLLQPDPVAAADDLVGALQSALASGDWVEVTHVDAHGRPQTDRVRVLGVSGGQVRIVRKASAPLNLSVARVVRVAPG
ncbi:helicase-associated domain-containing protein [Propionibacteriaceae bacterium G1746]